MKELREAIINYWSNQAEEDSEHNREELSGYKWICWGEEIKSHFPNKEKEEIKILDIGTGTGFLAIILAREGYKVTAIDCAERMIIEARRNTGMLISQIDYRVMDAQNLDFDDNSFDMIVSRNLLWGLEEPEKAYKEWHRVLKSGGVLINFDANWYRYLYDQKLGKGEEANREITREKNEQEDYLFTHNKELEIIVNSVPLSKEWRPDWDERILSDIGFSEVKIDKEVWNRVLTEEEKIKYATAPMFKIVALK